VVYYYTTFEPWKTHAGIEISGSLGGVYDANGHRTSAAITFKRQKFNPVTGAFERGRGVLALPHASPTNPQSNEQQYQRNKLTMAIAAWKNLSESEKEEWRQRALKDPWRTGHNIFVSRYLNGFENFEDEWGADFDDW
jgi:hypothetical protein